MRVCLDTTEFPTTVILTLYEKEGTTLSQNRHFLTQKSGISRRLMKSRPFIFKKEGLAGLESL